MVSLYLVFVHGENALDGLLISCFRYVLINAQGCLDAEKTRLLIICADFGCVDD